MNTKVECSRYVSKKMKLNKTVKEIYKHADLDVLEHRHDFSKMTLLPSKEVIEKYSSFLHCEDFNFLVYSCLSTDEQKRLKKMCSRIEYLRDEFISEIPETSNEIERLYSIQEYLTSRYTQGKFKTLTIENISKYLENTVFKDLMIEIKEKIPFERLIEDLQTECEFTEYSTLLDENHRAGKYTKATLMISSVNNQEGELIEKNSRTRVTGKQINRAMHGDEVYAENGRVVGVYKRKTTTLVGTVFKMSNMGGYNYGLVRPLDRRFPDFYIATFLDESLVGRKVVINYLDWSREEELPRGTLVKLMGATGVFEDEIQAILEHFGVEYRNEDWAETCNRQRKSLGKEQVKFTKTSTGASAEELGFDAYTYSVQRAVDEISTGKRQDFRGLAVCSIDPKGCTDIDDALHCIEKNGQIEVGIHIADVSFYVSEGSVLDQEAAARSTTVYLPDRRIDMLPPFLSSNLCSLHAGHERATLSCVCTFDKEFRLVSSYITRSVIKSAAALSYEEANAIINGTAHDQHVPDSLKPALVLLYELSKKLRADRLEKGALELGGDEVYIDVQGTVKIKEQIATHRLVEEFMLLANIEVAKFIYKHNPEYSLLRKHPLPSAIEIDGIDCTNSKTLNASLQSLTSKARTITKRVITRAMQQAVYFSSGESADFFHYGLATPIYTHFTSPIRRYPDVVVHRTLNYIFDQQSEMIDGLRDHVNKATCSVMNYRNRNAKNAGRMAADLFICRAVAEDQDKAVEAAVIGLRDFGVIVFVYNYGIEAVVHTKEKYVLFEHLKVKITRNFEKFCVDRVFEMEIVN